MIDQVNDLMNEQINKLKVQLNEAQAQERKLGQVKKQNDQMIEL